MKVSNIDNNLYLAKDILKQQLQGDQNVVGIGVNSNGLQVRVKQPTTVIPSNVNDFDVEIVIVGENRALDIFPIYNDKGEWVK